MIILRNKQKQYAMVDTKTAKRILDNKSLQAALASTGKPTVLQQRQIKAMEILGMI